MVRSILNPQKMVYDRLSIDLDLRTYLVTVYGYMAAGLGLTAFTAAIAAHLGLYQIIAGTRLVWPVLLAPFIIVLGFNFWADRIGVRIAQAMFWSYAIFMGVSLAGLFQIYIGENIASAFLIASILFLIMSLWGYSTDYDLSKFDSLLMMSLIGVTVACFVNLFLTPSISYLIISITGTLIFTGLAAWNAQRIREMYFFAPDNDGATKTAILGALTLYLDVINLFLSTIYLFTRRRDV